MARKNLHRVFAVKKYLVGAFGFLLIGSALLLATSATTRINDIEAEEGARSGTASVVADTAASLASAILFQRAVSSPSPSASPSASPSTTPSPSPSSTPKKVLLFHENQYQHDEYIRSGIEAGVAYVKAALPENGISVVATDSSIGVFTDANLAQYDAILFLSPSGDVLDDSEQVAFQNYIRSGKGFVGIHYAVAGLTEPGWPWYEQLIGGKFLQVAGANGDWTQIDKTTVYGTLKKTAENHPSTANLPATFSHRDEWYRFAYVPTTAKVLLTLEQTGLDFPVMTPSHPISWYQANFEGGRSFYTQLGDNAVSYQQENFQKHLLAAVQWAMTGQGL